MPPTLPGRSALRSALLPRLRTAASRTAAARTRNSGAIRLLEEEEGSALIELGISISTMLLFVFTLMQICIVLYSYSVIAEYAREGTRYASVRGSTCTTSGSVSCTATAASIQTYVSNIGLPNIGGGTVGVTATFPDGNQTPGSRVKVAVTYTVTIHLPFVPTRALALRSESVMFFVQ